MRLTKFDSRLMLSFISFFFFAVFLFDPLNIGLSLLGIASATLVLLGFILATEWLIKKISLKAFTFISLGLFLGLFVGEALLLFSLRYFPLAFLSSPLSQGVFCIATSFVGLRIAQLAAKEFFLEDTSHRKAFSRKLLVELSALIDPRLIDLASTGLFDGQLIVPAFIVKDLQMQLESLDESLKAKGRKGLENLKKLESMPHLHLSIVNTVPVEAEEYASKWVKLGKQLEAVLLTSDAGRFQNLPIEELKVINIHTLAHILKPLNSTGDLLQIKIQRYGKEPRQGVGYLEDGTMVVVNGGGEHIGETVKCFILSIKHTSTGRMIFCNVAEDELILKTSPPPHLEASPKHYFAL